MAVVVVQQGDDALISHSNLHIPPLGPPEPPDHREQANHQLSDIRKVPFRRVRLSLSAQLRSSVVAPGGRSTDPTSQPASPSNHVGPAPTAYALMPSPPQASERRIAHEYSTVTDVHGTASGSYGAPCPALPYGRYDGPADAGARVLPVRRMDQNLIRRLRLPPE